MSQSNVERVIGILATDEGLRRDFAHDPQDALRRMRDGGVDLTSAEMRALAMLDPRDLARFADAIDPRLQKSDLEGGCT
jgi:hypothetical protein